MISARAAHALMFFIALFERKHLPSPTVHCCDDSIRNLISKGAYCIGRALNIAGRHGERLVPEKIADKEASGHSCTPVQPEGVAVQKAVPPDPKTPTPFL